MNTHLKDDLIAQLNAHGFQFCGSRRKDNGILMHVWIRATEDATRVFYLPETHLDIYFEAGHIAVLFTGLGIDPIKDKERRVGELDNSHMAIYPPVHPQNAYVFKPCPRSLPHLRKVA